MLKEISAIPLRPHPELTILPSQPSPPVIRTRRDGSPQVISPPSPYNFDPPMPGARSPYSARRVPSTPQHLKTPKAPKTPKTPHATTSRHAMSRKSFGTLARRISSLTSRHNSSTSDAPPPMPPPYKGPPLFHLPADLPQSPEPLVLGSYPQFSPSSFFRGFDALRDDQDSIDRALSSGACANAGVLKGTKGLGLLPAKSLEDRLPIRSTPSTTSLRSPPPKVGLPPSPPSLFPRVSLFDSGVIEIGPEDALGDEFFADNRQSFDLGPLLFGSPLSPESYNSTFMFPAATKTSVSPHPLSDSAGLKLSHSVTDSSLLDSTTTLLTIPTIPSFPLERLASSTHNSEDTVRSPSLPNLREVFSSAQPQRISYIAPHPQHASPHLYLSPSPAPVSFSDTSPALLSPPLSISPPPSDYSSHLPSPRPGCDPLAELMAVAAELKSMVRPPSLSGRIMLQTRSPALSAVTSLSSPAISARQDAKALAAEFEAAGERVLEVRVHGEDVPAIVVVRPDSMYSIHARAFYPGGAEPVPGTEPDVLLLAPPLADERGRVDWYGHEQDGLPAYEYSEPLSLPKQSLDGKPRLSNQRRPTSMDDISIHPVHPVERTSASLGRKRRSPSVMPRERVFTGLQGLQPQTRGAPRTPPSPPYASRLASATDHTPPIQDPVTMTPRKGSIFKRALRMASSGFDVDANAAHSRNRTQTGSREDRRHRTVTETGWTVSESVRSRRGRTESGRASWRTLFERGGGKAPLMPVPIKEVIGSPRPLSPVAQWGWAEQGVLVGVI